MILVSTLNANWFLVREKKISECLNIYFLRHLVFREEQLKIKSCLNIKIFIELKVKARKKSSDILFIFLLNNQVAVLKKFVCSTLELATLITVSDIKLYS